MHVARVTKGSIPWERLLQSLHSPHSAPLRSREFITRCALFLDQVGLVVSVSCSVLGRKILPRDSKHVLAQNEAVNVVKCIKPLQTGRGSRDSDPRVD